VTETRDPGDDRPEDAAADTEPYQIRRLGRHSLVYGIGNLLTKAVAFIMLPIYTRLLTAADYGVLSLVFMTFEVVTIIAGSRIAIGIFHFYHKAESDEGRRKVLSTAFLVLAVTYTFAASITIAAAPQIARFVFGEGTRNALYLRVAAGSMAFEGLFLVPMALLQLQARSSRYVAVNLTRLGMQVVLNLIFLIPLDMGVLGVLLSSLISCAVIGVVLAARLVWQVGLRVDPDVARSFVRFGLPLVLMQVATFISTFGDRYFLNAASNTTQVGLYSLAYQFGFLVANIGFTPFHGIWDPQRFAIARRADRDEIFARVFVYLNILLLSVAVGVALFGGDVIRLMADQEFHAASVYVPVLAAAYVFQAWGSFLNLGIYLKERTGYFALANWTAAIVALAGYIWLIPIWYAWGAAVTTLLSLMTRAATAHVFSQRLWRVEYQWAPVVRLLTLAVAIGVAGAFLPSLSIVASIAAHTGLFAVYALLVWLMPVLEPAEREAAIQFVRERVAMLRAGR
jgi:O-antigen/teichoic acid export membrane protein